MIAVPPPIAEVIISALAEAITGEGHVTAIPGPPNGPITSDPARCSHT
jgi:hypothetical protein